jgi:hypothetical protein
MDNQVKSSIQSPTITSSIQGLLPMQAPFVDFIYLQILDVLTTMAFLWQGVEEGNPVVKAAMSVTSDPLSGLLLVKTVAIGLALSCWRSGRTGLLSKANFFFCGIVVWNLVAMLVQSTR